MRIESFIDFVRRLRSQLHEVVSALKIRSINILKFKMHQNKAAFELMIKIKTSDRGHIGKWWYLSYCKIGIFMGSYALPTCIAIIVYQ